MRAETEKNDDDSAGPSKALLRQGVVLCSKDIVISAPVQCKELGDRHATAVA